MSLENVDSDGTACHDASEVAYEAGVPSHGAPGGPSSVRAMLDQLRSFWNGTFVESFNATVASDGATVTMTIAKVGGGDLTMNFSSGQFPFTATTKTLTAGTDEVLKEQYVYILQSDHPTITVSDSDWPSAEHIRIAVFALSSAGLVQTKGAFVNQNINDHLMDTSTSQGHLSHIAATSRHRGAQWHEGCEGVATQDEDGNRLWVSVAAGIVHQMHEHTFAALNSDEDLAADPIFVVNDPDAAYTQVTDLNTITKRSDGVAIGVNKYVKFILWGVANKENTFSPMMLNLPSDEYNSVTAAASDASNRANFTIPQIFGSESSTGFLIAAFVCKHTAAGMEIEETIDLRDDGVGGGGGGTGGDVTATTTLTDESIIRGDSGGKGVQDSGVLVDDNDEVTGVASLTVVDSASIPPLNITERSAVPSAPAANDIYLDDGTNTGSGNPGWRRYTGAVWEDITAAAAGGGAGAPTDAEYVVLALDAGLSDERTLAVTDGLNLVDSGAGANVTLRTQSFVYITAVTGVGTISNKTYEANTVPSNKILTAFESDDDDITLTLEIHALSDNWQPASVQVTGAGATPVTVNKQDWSQVANTRIFTAAVNLTDADTTDTITATMSDGDTATVSYTRALDPPLVLTAVIDDHSTTTGGNAHCPLAQTQVKQGDTLDISGTAESHADEVYVKDYEVTNGEGEQGPFAVAGGVWSGTINVGSGTDATANYQCYAKVTGGTAGADFISTENVDKDQTSPTFGSPSVAYTQAGAEALKGTSAPNADAQVTATHTNIEAGDSYVYSDNGQSELTISNTQGGGADTTTYQATKWVRRSAGNYRDDGDTDNYKLIVTRLQKNGKAANTTTVVEIAHATPVVAVYKNSGTTAPTRMGTDDGTNNYADHYAYVTGDQKHLSTSTSSVAPDAGDTSAFIGSWSEYNDYRFRRQLRVEDGDINAGGQAANDFSWTSVSFENRAKTVVTTVTTNPDYSIGGFAARTLTIPAWPNREADCSVFAVDTAKLTSENLSKGGAGPNGGTVFTFDNSPGEGNPPDDEVDKFCMTNGSDVVDDDGTFWYNKDQANAISNSSGTAQVIVEETA